MKRILFCFTIILSLIFASNSYSVERIKAKRIFKKRDVHWIALNIYHEGKNLKSIKEKMAFAYVVIHRANNTKFPHSIPEVVTDKDQFSWYWDGKCDVPKNKKIWESSKTIAKIAISTYRPDAVGGALFYHANYVHPKWARKKRLVASIGKHKFYR